MSELWDVHGSGMDGSLYSIESMKDNPIILFGEILQMIKTEDSGDGGLKMDFKGLNNWIETGIWIINCAFC